MHSPQWSVHSSDNMSPSACSHPDNLSPYPTYRHNRIHRHQKLHKHYLFRHHTSHRRQSRHHHNCPDCPRPAQTCHSTNQCHQRFAKLPFQQHHQSVRQPLYHQLDRRQRRQTVWHISKKAVLRAKNGFFAPKLCKVYKNENVFSTSGVKNLQKTSCKPVKISL